MKLKNGMELSVSKAVKSDAKAIIEYLNIVGGESNNLLFGKDEFNMTVENEEIFIGNMNSHSVLLVGKIDNEIVCIGSVQVSDRERISHQGDIAVSVKKAYWGIGIGTKLLKIIIDFAKSTNKIEILHLGVKSDNANAVTLYKKMGFEEIGLYKRFFKINGEYGDEILMNLYL